MVPPSEPAPLAICGPRCTSIDFNNSGSINVPPKRYFSKPLKTPSTLTVTSSLSVKPRTLNVIPLGRGPPLMATPGISRIASKILDGCVRCKSSAVTVVIDCVLSIRFSLILVELTLTSGNTSSVTFISGVALLIFVLSLLISAKFMDGCVRFCTTVFIEILAFLAWLAAASIDFFWIIFSNCIVCKLPSWLFTVDATDSPINMIASCNNVN